MSVTFWKAESAGTTGTGDLGWAEAGTPARAEASTAAVASPALARSICRLEKCAETTPCGALSAFPVRLTFMVHFLVAIDSELVESGQLER